MLVIPSELELLFRQDKSLNRYLVSSLLDMNAPGNSLSAELDYQSCHCSFRNESSPLLPLNLQDSLFRRPTVLFRISQRIKKTDKMKSSKRQIQQWSRNERRKA